MITFEHRGDFGSTSRWLKRLQREEFLRDLEKYGRDGVAALQAGTPVESGATANSWDYEIEHGPGSVTISWTNSNIENGVNIAVILQYGHGTGTGGWVQGRDYINPAVRPVFDSMTEEVWKKVTKP